LALQISTTVDKMIITDRNIVLMFLGIFILFKLSPLNKHQEIYPKMLKS